MQEARSRYAVLGMLSVQPMSGYDIKQAIERSIGNFWSLSYGQIYPMLKALVAEGLAVKDVEAGTGKPDRHVYTLTDAGHEALVRWIEAPIEALPARNEHLLKLFFGKEVPPGVHARHVERLRASYGEALARYDAITRLNASTGTMLERAYRGMTIRYGQLVAQAVVKWCDETLDALSSLPSRATRT